LILSYEESIKKNVNKDYVKERIVEKAVLVELDVSLGFTEFYDTLNQRIFWIIKGFLDNPP